MAQFVASESNEPSTEAPLQLKPLPAGNQPWNPTWFIGMTFIFGFGAAGILAGINWRRLGKPKWIWPTIIFSVAAEIGLIALFTSLKISASYIIGLSGNLLFGFFFYYIQKLDYAEWKTTYDLKGSKSPGCAIPLGIGIGSLAVVLAGVIGIPKIQTYVLQQHLDSGLKCMNQGDYDRAIVEFNEIMKINPDEPVAYINRGVAYINKNELDLAIADFNKAIQLNPNISLAYRDRGLTYYYKGDYDTALADLEKAIQIDPQVAQSYLGRGFIYVKMGVNEKAIADFNKTLELSDDPGVRQSAQEQLSALGE